MKTLLLWWKHRSKMMWLLMMFVARWQTAHRPMDTQPLAPNASNSIVYSEELPMELLIPAGFFFQEEQGKLREPVNPNFPSVLISVKSNMTSQI